MSTSKQYFTKSADASRVFAYGIRAGMLANENADVVAFKVPTPKKDGGLLIGLGLSNTAAWKDGYFVVKIGTVEIMRFVDELCDLKRPMFLPVEIQKNDVVTVAFRNGGSVASVDASVRCSYL